MEKQILYVLILCFFIIIVIAAAMTRSDEPVAGPDMKQKLMSNLLPEAPQIPKPTLQVQPAMPAPRKTGTHKK